MKKNYPSVITCLSTSAPRAWIKKLFAATRRQGVLLLFWMTIAGFLLRGILDLCAGHWLLAFDAILICGYVCLLKWSNKQADMALDDLARVNRIVRYLFEERVIMVVERTSIMEQK